MHLLLWERRKKWSFTQRKVYVMRVYGNKMLRRLFGHRGEVTGGWKCKMTDFVIALSLFIIRVMISRKVNGQNV
jgi:hypothetical protein